MILGYNTNGFAHHRLSDALAIMAELGYRGVALTPDVNHLDPATVSSAERQSIRAELDRCSLACVIETGSRFLLDPRRKHFPTLLDASEPLRLKRRQFLESCVDLAKDLGSPIVSFWSGAKRTQESNGVVMARLVEECLTLADYAAKQNVRLAFEPEPGMFIDTMDRFAELHAANHPYFRADA
ncbi:MAG: TIM barrel protein [Gemmataceae bacterium]